jgi:hypothetical protein
MARCELTELDTQFCDHCRPKPVSPRVPQTRPSSAPQPFHAVHPGKCVGCGEAFPAGTLIRRAPEQGWLADCCDDT